MPQIAAESFTGAAGTELSALSSNWVRITGISANVVLTPAGRGRSSLAGNTAAYRRTEVPPSAAYSASCDVYLATVDNSASGPAVRWSASANTGYYARYHGGNQQLQLYKIIAGVSTQIGSGVAQAVAAGGTINVRLEVAGSALRVYADGNALAKVSQSDSAITAAGFPGIRILAVGAGDTTGQHLDNFSADAASTATSVAIGTAVESDTALPVGVAVGIPPAVETDTALPLGVELPVIPATETGVALPLGSAVGITPAIEADTALPLDAVLAPAPIAISVPIGRAAEVDVALALGVAVGIRPATETDAALQLAVVAGPPVTFTRAPAGVGYAPGAPVLHRPASVATARPHIAAPRRPTS